MRGFNVRFGPVRVRIEAEPRFDEALDALREWLSTDGDASESPDVCLTMRESPQALGPVPNAWRDGSSLGWWDGKAWDAALSRESPSDELRWDLFLHEGPLVRAVRWSPAFAVRAAHVHYFGYAEILASAVLYSHLLPAAQIALVRRDATLAHASSLTGPEGGGVLVLGWGGAGKTSASSQLYLLQPERWRYMSDDLAVIGRDGALYRSPVPVNVFPYNTESFTELEQLVFGRMSRFSRMQWRLRAAVLGPGNVARRMAPLQRFLGPDRAVLREVIELERADVPSAQVVPSDHSVLAASARKVLAHELRRGFDGVASALTLPGSAAVVPSPVELLAASESILLEAFTTIRAQRIVLPRAAPPADVGRIVERALGASRD